MEKECRNLYAVVSITLIYHSRRITSTNLLRWPNNEQAKRNKWTREKRVKQFTNYQMSNRFNIENRTHKLTHYEHWTISSFCFTFVVTLILLFFLWMLTVYFGFVIPSNWLELKWCSFGAIKWIECEILFYRARQSTYNIEFLDIHVGWLFFCCLILVLRTNKSNVKSKPLIIIPNSF